MSTQAPTGGTGGGGKDDGEGDGGNTGGAEPAPPTTEQPPAQQQPAPAPTAPPPTGAAEPETRFVREGEFWTIAYAGTTTRLRDVKGLGYIATLLAAPGLDVHVLELVAGGSNGRALDGDELHALDPQAKEEYRQRLEDLRSELEEARGFGDEERAAGLEEEIDALVGQLAQAVGLGGRDRPSSSPGERARVNVTKAIRTAIKLIERESPQLADHLRAAIRTGRFCSYAPPGEAPPRWATTVPS